MLFALFKRMPHPDGEHTIYLYNPKWRPNIHKNVCLGRLNCFKNILHRQSIVQYAWYNLRTPLANALYLDK